MAPDGEFRVSWRREGCGRVTRIYQTEAAARRKAEGIVALEKVKAGSRFDEMPDLVELPTIETRPVGSWLPVAEQPGAPSVEACERMEAWATPDDGYSGIF